MLAFKELLSQEWKILREFQKAGLERTYKPGFVPSVIKPKVMIISLGRRLLGGSSDLPGSR
jgi:hypothetical protein